MIYTEDAFSVKYSILYLPQDMKTTVKMDILLSIEEYHEDVGHLKVTHFFKKVVLYIHHGTFGHHR